MDSAVVVALILSIVGNIINAWGMIYMKIGHEAANAKRMARALQRYLQIRAEEEAGSPNSTAAKRNAAKVTSAELSASFLREMKWWVGMATYGVGSLVTTHLSDVL